MEVENVIAQHPAVSQCAVIGIPRERWGETVHAFVIPTANRLQGFQQFRRYHAEHVAERRAEMR